MTTFNDGSPVSAPDSLLTLAQARAVVAGAVLQLPSNTVDNTRLDTAIQAAGEEFMRKVQPVRSYDLVTTTKDNFEVSFSADGFLPRRLTRATVIVDDAPQEPMGQVNRTAIEAELENKESGVPTMIAFRNASTALVYPIPDDAYDIRMEWWTPFVEFTAGTASPEDVSLNIPTDMIHGVLWYGVPSYYNRGNEKQQFVREARARFDLHIRECRGMVDNNSIGGAIYVNPKAY